MATRTIRSMICAYCDNFLCDPIELLCMCTICEYHLNNKNGQITCPICNENKYLPKKIKQNSKDCNDQINVQKSILELKKLFNKYNIKCNDFDHLHAMHFSKLEKDIKERSEKFINFVDEIANAMLDKLKQSKQNYDQQKEFSGFEIFMGTFKNSNIKEAKIEHLNEKINFSNEVLKSKLSEIEELTDDLLKFNFIYRAHNCEKRCLKHVFGFLKNNSKTCDTRSNDQNIQTDPNDLSSKNNQTISGNINLNNLIKKCKMSENFTRSFKINLPQNVVDNWLSVKAAK